MGLLDKNSQNRLIVKTPWVRKLDVDWIQEKLNQHDQSYFFSVNFNIEFET